MCVDCGFEKLLRVAADAASRQFRLCDAGIGNKPYETCGSTGRTNLDHGTGDGCARRCYLTAERSAVSLKQEIGYGYDDGRDSNGKNEALKKIHGMNCAL